MNKQTIQYKNGNGHGHHPAKSPAEIEQEIQATRLRMEHTIQAIKNDLTPGQLVDQAVQFFKDGKVGAYAGRVGAGVGRGASSAASSLGVIVKENPLPAALIGAGLAWMAASSYRAKHPKPYAVGGELSSSFGGESASLGSFNSSFSEGEEYGSSISSVSTTDYASTYQHGEPSRMEGVKEKAKGAVESVKAKGHSIKERAASGGSALKMKASSGGHAIKQRASSVSHGAAEKARFAKQKTMAASVRAKEGAVNTYEQQPLIIGAIAIGVGALLGAALPISSRENRVMGRKRDMLVDKARDKADVLGSQAVERAKGLVDQGVQKVKSGIEQKAGVVEGESLDAPTTGVMSGTSAYGTSSVNPFVETTTTSVSTTTQAAPLPVPEEDLGNTAGGSVAGGPLTDLSQEREVGGMEPSSFPPKGRGPGF